VPITESDRHAQNKVSKENNMNKICWTTCKQEIYIRDRDIWFKVRDLIHFLSDQDVWNCVSRPRNRDGDYIPGANNTKPSCSYKTCTCDCTCTKIVNSPLTPAVASYDHLIPIHVSYLTLIAVLVTKVSPLPALNYGTVYKHLFGHLITDSLRSNDSSKLICFDETSAHLWHFV